jgi:hypothetical protein
MIIYTALLDCGTVGTVAEDTIDGYHLSELMGETVNVHLHDENGYPVEVSGKLIDILEIN